MAQGARTTATRTELAVPTTDGLADRPSACLQVVDRDSGKPIAGAAVRRVQGGAELAFTDGNGLASVPLKQPEQLAVVMDGYLLRMAPTQLGSTEAEPQRVVMVRDAWSLRRRFEFVGTDGKNAADVFVRFRPRDEQAAKAASGPPPGDAVLQRAWSEHVKLATQPVCADVAVQLGAYSEDRVHRLADRAQVRFVSAGEFAIEVATATGDVGRATFHIDPARGNAETVRIALERGHYATGRVVGPGAESPLAAASLTLQGGEPLGLVATSGVDGSFRLGPLAKGPVTLHVRHGDHEPLAFGPVASDAIGIRIVLQPLPKSTLRGRVRALPDLRAIEGAHVSWTPSAGNAITATTIFDGTFQLAATGETAARLIVSAPGHLPYTELVQPGSPFAEYDLWPSATAVRLERGLTAMLMGTVQDAAGRPIAGVSVRWIPARPTASVGQPGRRALDGATLELPLIVSTGPDGAFVLETTQFGAGRMCFADAGPAATGGVETEAVAGATKNDLQLRR